MHLRDFASAVRGLRGALATFLLVTAVAPAYSQALDTPTLISKGGGFFRIDLDVQAGDSGAPNGFVVQWMKRTDYEAYGWPSDNYDPLVAYCEFYGEPTLNVDSRSSSYYLPANGLIEIQMGDLFDETGLSGSYLDAVVPGEYAFRVWAQGDGYTPGTGSLASETQFFSTVGDPECTQGFWKTHPEAWPVGCAPITLGTVSYTATELLNIFNTPAAGNGLIALAHQLITVRLNECNGSDLTNIAGDVAAADALIGGLVIPPVGAGYIHPSQTSALTQTLDDYNNGLIEGVVSCATPSRKATWGKLKSIFR